MIRGEVQGKLCECESCGLSPLGPVPYGYCHCRCGGLAPIAKFTDHRKGHIKDRPVRFIRGHHGRGTRRWRLDLAASFWEQVDKNGQIIRPELGPCWLWLSDTANGYGQIKVNGRNRQATHIALELVGYIIPCEWLEVMHKCDNRPCVRPDHLRIVPHDENIADMVAKGRQARGEDHSQAKLDQGQIQEIRALYQRGVRSRGYRVIARQFGVTPSNIKAIVCGKTWTGQGHQ